MIPIKKTHGRVELINFVIKSLFENKSKINAGNSII